MQPHKGPKYSDIQHGVPGRSSSASTRAGERRRVVGAVPRRRRAPGLSGRGSWTASTSRRPARDRRHAAGGPAGRRAHPERTAPAPRLAAAPLRRWDARRSRPTSTSRRSSSCSRWSASSRSSTPPTSPCTSGACSAARASSSASRTTARCSEDRYFWNAARQHPQHLRAVLGAADRCIAAGPRRAARHAAARRGPSGGWACCCPSWSRRSPSRSSSATSSATTTASSTRACRRIGLDADPLAHRPARQPRRDRHDGQLALDRLQRADLPRRHAGRPARPLRGGRARRRRQGPAVPLRHAADDPADDDLRRHHLDHRRPADLRRAAALRRDHARYGGADRQYQTITMYLYELGWQRARPRPRLGGRLAAVPPDHRAFALVNLLLTRRIAQPGGSDPSDHARSRPGFLGLRRCLAAFLAADSVGSRSTGRSSSARTPPRSPIRASPPLLPGGHFFDNAERVFDTVPFWKALGNSLLVSTVVAASVVFFSTLAGYAFAKLRFRGRTGAAGLRRRDDGGPDPARRHPAVHPDVEARLDRHDVGGDRPRAGHRVRRLLHAAVPRRRRARRADRGRPRGRLLA